MLADIFANLRVSIKTFVLDPTIIAQVLVFNKMPYSLTIGIALVVR